MKKISRKTMIIGLVAVILVAAGIIFVVSSKVNDPIAFTKQAQITEYPGKPINKTFKKYLGGNVKEEWRSKEMETGDSHPGYDVVVIYEKDDMHMEVRFVVSLYYEFAKPYKVYIRDTSYGEIHTSYQDEKLDQILDEIFG